MTPSYFSSIISHQYFPSPPCQRLPPHLRATRVFSQFLPNPCPLKILPNAISSATNAHPTSSPEVLLLVLPLSLNCTPSRTSPIANSGEILSKHPALHHSLSSQLVVKCVVLCYVHLGLLQVPDIMSISSIPTTNGVHHLSMI